MKKTLTTICSFLLLYVATGIKVFAQQKQLTGTVLSSDGLPVKLASVQVIGTKRGTTADELGEFKITVTVGEELEVSSIGFVTSKIKVEQKNKLVITLTRSGNDLGDVVVTALGISRSKKTLGYAVQKLDGSQLNVARDNNIINSLSGKIAGVQVTSGGSAVGASSKIVIRGNSSFGTNSPLFVVDGVPIFNNGTNLDGGGGIDWGNTASDIDPNNIESLTVAATEDATMSRMTIVTSGSDEVIEQIIKQLNKLIDVIKVLDLNDGKFIERELMLVKVKATPAFKEEMKRMSDIFRGRVIDVADNSYTIELTGSSTKLDAFLEAIDKTAIIETVRTGASGIGRGDRILRL